MSAFTTPSGRTLRPPPAVLVLASLDPDRAAVARVARELGYRAIEADDPAEVLRRLRAQPAMAQLLLVEVALPGMDGGEVAERARDVAPGLRIVLLTSDPDGADAELIRAYPELPVVELPFDRRTLVGILRGALGRSRAGTASGERRGHLRGSGRPGAAGEIAGPGAT